MRIVGIYSFNKGKEIVEKTHPGLLAEIDNIIVSIDASKYKSKKSKEKTMKGRMLYSPVKLNKAFKSKFQQLNWQTVREKCSYPKQYYIQGYSYPETRGAFREMDLEHRGVSNIDIPVLIYGIGV